MLWVFITVEDFSTWDLRKLRDALETAKTTVQFAPMLCVLFVATRIRALQLSDNKGAPQGWAQDGMYMASWAVLIQFAMCLLMPLFTGGKRYDADALDGSQAATKEPITHPYGKYVIVFLRYLALIFLFAGVAMA